MTIYLFDTVVDPINYNSTNIDAILNAIKVTDARLNLINIWDTYIISKYILKDSLEDNHISRSHHVEVIQKFTKLVTFHDIATNFPLHIDLLTFATTIRHLVSNNHLDRSKNKRIRYNSTTKPTVTCVTSTYDGLHHNTYLDNHHSSNRNDG